jgi:hypothetical protein
MNKQITVGAIAMMTIITLATVGTTVILTLQPAVAQLRSVWPGEINIIRALKEVPIAISGDDIYIAWSNNKTGNDEVMFRTSNDAGANFTDKINLSNSTNTESQNVELAADGDNVIITWWERNQTADEPVAIISSDGGTTFGPLLKLATNGTIGEAAGEG